MDALESRRLQRERTLLLKRVASVGDFLRGSVVLMKRKCGLPRCRRCARGEGHPAWVLTYSERGKTHTVYLGRRRHDEARRLVENYRRVAGWLEEAARINLVLFKDRPQDQEAGDGKGR